MANSRPMVEFRNVCCQLGGRPILHELSFTVERGEIYVIIGYSGTGKSVTLQNLTGLLTPQKGLIYVDGQQIVGMDENELMEARRKFGFLFQSGALINWMTVAENVELPLREHTSLARKTRQQVVAEKLRLVNMEEDGNKYPSEISGGMKKRAALARAIALDPEIVLFDEPTSGLDPVISRQIDELIKAINKVMGITCIVVTHDMESAYGIASNIAFFYKGKMHVVGSPSEIKAEFDPALRHFISGGKEGRLTAKSLTSIIHSRPASLDDDDEEGNEEATPISTGIVEGMTAAARHTRRITIEDMRQVRNASESGIHRPVSVRTRKVPSGDGAAPVTSNTDTGDTASENPEAINGTARATLTQSDGVSAKGAEADTGLPSDKETTHTAHVPPEGAPTEPAREDTP